MSLPLVKKMRLLLSLLVKKPFEKAKWVFAASMLMFRSASHPLNAFALMSLTDAPMLMVASLRQA